MDMICTPRTSDVITQLARWFYKTGHASMI
jgi:hypothetical protein